MCGTVKNIKFDCFEFYLFMYNINSFLSVPLFFFAFFASFILLYTCVSVHCVHNEDEETHKLFSKPVKKMVSCWCC